MKKFFLFSLITISLGVSGQTYHHFPDSTAKWSEYRWQEFHWSGGNYSISRNGWLYAFGKDTLINSYKYKLVGYQPTWYDYISGGGGEAHAYDDVIKLPGQIFGALREDPEKKVWFRNFYSSPSAFPYCSFLTTLPADTEILIYDFNLKVGDTLKWSFQTHYPGYNYQRIVLFIDSIKLEDNSWRKKFNFQYSGQYYQKDYWVEGMGSSFGLFGAYASLPQEYEYCYINCFWENGKYLFHKPDYPPNGTQCDRSKYPQTEVGIDEVSSPNSLLIYPNPVTSIINFSSPSLISSIEIFDLLGRKIISQSAIPKSSSNYSIDMSAYPKGYYFVRIHSSEGIVNRKFVLQ